MSRIEPLLVLGGTLQVVIAPARLFDSAFLLALIYLGVPHVAAAVEIWR